MYQRILYKQQFSELMNINEFYLTYEFYYMITNRNQYRNNDRFKKIRLLHLWNIEIYFLAISSHLFYLLLKHSKAKFQVNIFSHFCPDDYKRVDESCNDFPIFISSCQSDIEGHLFRPFIEHFRSSKRSLHQKNDQSRRQQSVEAQLFDQFLCVHHIPATFLFVWRDGASLSGPEPVHRLLLVRHVS